MGLGIYDEIIGMVQESTWGPANSTGVVNATGLYTFTYRIDNISAVSSDTIDHLVQVWLASGWICTINVPAGAGNGTVPTVDLMAAIKAATGMDHLLLMPSTRLQFATPVVMSTGKQIWFVMVGGSLTAQFT